jgi:hypothetical protein
MPGVVKGPQTLYDKIFNDHIVDEKDDGTILLYVGEFSVMARRLGAEADLSIQTDILHTKSHHQ